METESGVEIRNGAGTGAEVGIKVGVRTSLVFEAIWSARLEQKGWAERE